MLCSTLRRAAVGQRACAKCSVRANSLILATKPRSGTDRPLRTRVRNSRPGLLPTRAFTGASKPNLFVPERGFVSIFGRFFCTIAAEPMASGKPTRKGARILCADSEREGLLCADSAGEGLDDGRNPRLGWRGRKRAALLPARSETHRQSAPRRPGSSLPVRATIRCPPWFSRQGQLGAPPPLHRSRSDGIERGRGSVSSRLEKGCRPAIPHGSFPLSAPKVRMRCRRARVSGEGGASLPAHARQKCGPLALPIAGRLHVSHRGRADTPWPFPFRRALFAASCRISFASRSAIFAANLVKPSFLS